MSVGEDGRVLSQEQSVHLPPRSTHLSSASDSAVWIQVGDTANRWASGAISSKRSYLLPPLLDPLGAVAAATQGSSHSGDTRALAFK